MAWTAADEQELERLIVSGVVSAAHRDKRHTYRSLDELLRALNIVKQKRAAKRRGPAGFAKFGKGLH